MSRNFICENKCALAGGRKDLEGDCRQSDELEFFSCLERQEDGEKCCNNVANDTCRAMCTTTYHNPGKSSPNQLNDNHCQNQMPKCLKTITEAESAENPKQCKQSLSTLVTGSLQANVSICYPQICIVARKLHPPNV